MTLEAIVADARIVVPFEMIKGRKDIPTQKKLQALRYQYGLTQNAMADKVGMKRTTYAVKESGRTKFLVKEAIHIYTYFKELDATIEITDIFSY